MFDLNGNVIGINSALISPTGASVGIGLAIPAELAKPVIDSLRRGQRPQRGYLGIGLQPLDENIASSLGLPKDRGEIVRSVIPGGAAARAGIQQGDVIVRVNGQEVNPDQTVSYLIANTPVGSQHSDRHHPRRAAGSGHRDGRPAPDRGATRPAARQRWRRPGRSRRRHGGTRPAGARPVAAAADPRAGAGGEPARDRSRRDHHRGRPQQRCRGRGAAARRPHHVGQSPAGHDSGAGHRRGRGGAAGRPDQRAAAGQARCHRSNSAPWSSLPVSGRAG